MGFSWGVLGIVCFWGLAAVILGVMGFSPTGIPLTRNTRIAGLAGKVTGGLCVLLGLAILWGAGHSILGPAEDGFARSFVRGFPYGVAVYSFVQILWLSKPRGKEPREFPQQPKRPRLATSGREVGDIVECPHCKKRMVDTAAERSRFCGKDLPPMLRPIPPSHTSDK
jgi:hypothetical protein